MPKSNEMDPKDIERFNHGVVDAYSEDAKNKGREEYGVVLLLDAKGLIVNQYGYSRPEGGLHGVKKLLER